MQRYLKTTAVALLATTLGTPAIAAPMIDIQVIANVTDAPAALNGFTAGKDSFVTETFEAPNFTAADGSDPTTEYSGPIQTDVGVFSRGGGASDGSGQCIFGCTKPQVLSTSTSPFGGRKDTTNGAGDGQWLDTNDVSEIVWAFDLTDPASVNDSLFSSNTFNHLAFFMTDVSDQGATLEVTFANGSTAVETVTGQGNGTINFVTAKFGASATGASVTFTNTLNNITGDGFGIDDATIAVPVPASVALLGVGLIGLGVAARRRARGQA
jgi:hypothetical protein